MRRLGKVSQSESDVLTTEPCRQPVYILMSENCSGNVGGHFYSRVSGMPAGHIRAPVQLHGTIYLIVSVIQRGVLTVFVETA